MYIYIYKCVQPLRPSIAGYQSLEIHAAGCMTITTHPAAKT